MKPLSLHFNFEIGVHFAITFILGLTFLILHYFRVSYSHLLISPFFGAVYFTLIRVFYHPLGLWMTLGTTIALVTVIDCLWLISSTGFATYTLLNFLLHFPSILVLAIVEVLTEYFIDREVEVITHKEYPF